MQTYTYTQKERDGGDEEEESTRVRSHDAEEKKNIANALYS